MTCFLVVAAAACPLTARENQTLREGVGSMNHQRGAELEEECSARMAGMRLDIERGSAAGTSKDKDALSATTSKTARRRARLTG